MPDGTVITLVQYAAKLDAQGNPEKDANGRFIKTNVVGYTQAYAAPAAGYPTASADSVPSSVSSSVRS